jgi:ribosome maturation factor RimP
VVFGGIVIVYYICIGKKNQQKGTEAFPSFINMTPDTIITATTELINPILADQPSLFLVQVKIKPTNNIKVFLDGDTGIDIDACVKINRALYKQIEELAWFPDGNFSLEVSSSGIDEPLKLHRQYIKNIGRNIEVLLLDGTKYEGKLIATDDNGIQITFTEGKNKKAVVINKEITFDAIKQTKVLVAF